MTHRFDLLEPGLALSGKPRNAAVLEELPFRGILNLSDFDPPGYARGLHGDIELVRRPINDIYPVPSPYLTLAVLELAELRRREVETLVHCHAGRSRSPTVVALYWMARDGLSWDAALERVRALRRDAEVGPNRFFLSEPGRPRIVAAVRALLAGEPGVLEAARARREALIRAFRQRPADPAGPEEDWNLVTSGLALGGLGASREALAAAGIRDVVAVEGPEAPAAGGVGIAAAGTLGAVLDRVAAQRAAGQGLCLVSAGDGFAAIFAACALLVLRQGHDVATALWALGSRRSAVWQHVEALWATNWDGWRAVAGGAAPNGVAAGGF